jgi:GNAT superfamily N-acetyltransferase
MPTGPPVLDSAVRARPFRADDEPHVLGLLQAVFREWPREISGATPAEFFRWKHVDGPYGPSSMVVAEADGRVVGFAAYMPWRFTTGGRVVNAVRGVDLVVHPAYRMRGVSLALRTATKFASDVGFSWSNPNVDSRPGGRKVGRRPVRIVTQFIQPRGPGRALLRACAGGARTPRRISIDAPPAAGVIGEAPLTSLLDHSAPAHHRLATLRTVDYLRWRYGRHADYRAIRVERDGAGAGVVIFRCRRHGSLWASHICELLVDRGDRVLVRSLLQQVREAAPVDFIRCSFASRSEAAAHGFVHYRRGLLLTISPLQRGLAPDPTRPDSWALSIGDLELL